jgi:hypothetical protein
MRAPWIVPLALSCFVASTGCSIRPGAFACETDTDCTRGGEQGVCESVGHCSFADPDCASGRRFGDLSGSQSGQCVGDPPIDGGLDGPTASSDAGTNDDAAVTDAPTTDAATPDAPTGCPPGYEALPGIPTHFYRRLGVAGWTNQRTVCGSEPANVYLAIPDDQAELDAIIALAAADVWVGISDASSEGVFVTVLGTPATFLPFAQGEPDNQGNQDCVRARAATAQYETANCGLQSIAVCECDP